MAEEEKIGADETSDDTQETEKKERLANHTEAAESNNEETPAAESGAEELVLPSNEETPKTADDDQKVPTDEPSVESANDVSLAGGEATDVQDEKGEDKELVGPEETPVVNRVKPVDSSDKAGSTEDQQPSQIVQPEENADETSAKQRQEATIEDKAEQSTSELETADVSEPVENTEPVKAKKELKSEEDLDEKGHDDEEHEEEDVDYSQLSKQELVDTIKALAKDDNVIKSDRVAREIKPYFDEIRDKERREALQRFIADGGEEKDFDFKFDELANRFDANFKLIHDRKVQYIKDRENQKENNLKKKEDILERLRVFVDSDDPNISFNDFKEFQNEWKAIGPVPPAYARTLWANYNALVDRFYDHRNIYFELKELDRKKNLKLKLELCEKAEQLSNIDNLPEAIKALNELHHEFKHIGPVPKDDQEPLWQRFKAASDAVYDNRKGFVEQLKKELEKNLVLKEELAEKTQEFVVFDTERIKEWNVKTKELLELQKKWEAVGGLPRAKAKEVNKKFWGAFKTFFHNKGAFFKKLDGQRETNLEGKRELVTKAEELKESTDWNKTADAFKKLQREWREIGPVPEKYRESVYQEFKKACDHFFDQRRNSQNEAEKEYVGNYTQKMKICDELNAAASTKEGSLEQLRELQNSFNSIGFVPRKNISETKKKYAEAVEAYIASLEGISQDDRQKLKVEEEINKISSGPNAGQRIFRKEQSLRHQIGQVENDISVWKNNMEFFASSKTADKLKNEFQEKIDAANIELTRLKNELRILRSVT
ncbi:MAG: DUF349 domain-containing protein [Bacteroidota bacterium]